MSWISVPEMVAAVSNAGGLGILATGPLDKDTTRESIRRIRKLTDKPFGANASLLFPGATESARVLLDEQVPVINFALGKGDWIVKEAHKYGGKVIATVVNSRHAKRAEEYGCDAVIATGNEAAAHGEFVTTFCLIPSLVNALPYPGRCRRRNRGRQGPGCSAGPGRRRYRHGDQVHDHKRKPAPQELQRALPHKGCHRHFILKAFRWTVLPCYEDRILPSVQRSGAWTCLPPSSTRRTSRSNCACPFIKLFIGVMLSGWKNTKQLAYLANASHAFQLATEEGDLKKGVLPVGQCTGLIKDEPTVKELFDRMVSEAEGIEKRMAGIFA